MTIIERKVEHLPGTRLTPDVVLARTMEKKAQIKAVAVLIQWDDETFDMDWSQMKVSELCMAEKIFGIHVDEALADAAVQE
jgi:hypothetical protein